MSCQTDDFISFSPSLPYILSFIDYKDLRSFKLVSRRFHHLVRTHISLLPRPKISVTVYIVQKENCSDFVHVRAFKPSDDIVNSSSCRTHKLVDTKFFLTEDRIRLMDSPKYITREFEAIDKQFAIEMLIFDLWSRLLPPYHNRDDILGKLVAEKSFERSIDDEPILGTIPTNVNPAYRKCRDFHIRGAIEKAFPAILSLLFKRFHIETLRILYGTIVPGSARDQWMEQLASIFRSSRSRCNLLALDRVWGGMDRFIKTIDSESCEFLSAEIASLSSLECFDRNIMAGVNGNRFHSLGHLVQLIKRWEAGRISIKNLRVFTHNIRTYRDFFADDQLLKTLGCFNVLFTRVGDKDGLRVFLVYLTRPIDDMVLGVAHTFNKLRYDRFYYKMEIMQFYRQK